MHAFLESAVASHSQRKAGKPMIAEIGLGDRGRRRLDGWQAEDDLPENRRAVRPTLQVRSLLALICAMISGAAMETIPPNGSIRSRRVPMKVAAVAAASFAQG